MSDQCKHEIVYDQKFKQNICKKCGLLNSTIKSKEQKSTETLPQDYSYIDEILDKLLAGRDINHSRPKTSKTQAKHSIIKAIEAEVEPLVKQLDDDLQKFNELWEVWGVEHGVDYNMEAIEKLLEQHLKRKEEE